MASEKPADEPLKSDERYRLLVDAVTDYAIYMLDAQGFVSSWNTGAQRFKQYTRDEIVGQHFSVFYTAADRAAGLPTRALETAATAGRFEAEGWRVRKNGERFWAHVIIDPIRDAAGTLIGFAKITRDLTERQLAQETLQRSEELFDLLVKGVTDYAIYMLDVTGHISNWNVGAQRIKGYAPGEIIGSHFSRFYTDEDRHNGLPERALETAARDGRFEAEGWRVRKDGSQFWANVVVDAIRDSTGKLLGFAKITRDVTEKREAQRALEKTRELLFQTQKMEAIGRLSGGIAHDFNNILMAVLSSLALVKKRIGPEHGASRLVENAMLAARRGSSLTQRLLAFARRQDLTPESVRLPTLLEGMADLLARSLGPTISIETHFPLGLPPVMVDANQLELALLNLAVNARDAMPKGGTIVVAAEVVMVPEADPNTLRAGSYVVTSVIDRGEGMDDATLSRALEPFFTTKGVGKGTGLGLSMVDGLAAQSSGRFELLSEIGRGTTARLWLPVALTAPKESSATPIDAARVPPMTVLAVDDDALVLMSTVVMLEELGHTVLQTTGATEALELIKRNDSIGLLLTDHAMPQMTGADLIAALRELRPTLPVILATGYAELAVELPSHVQRLAKPFDQHELAEAIAVASSPRPTLRAG